VVLLPPGPPTLAEIGAAIRVHGVTTVWLTAGLFHAMVDERLHDLKPLRQLLAGGDVLSPEHVRKARRALPDCRIVNGYGPTENTTFTTFCPLRDPAEVGASVPLGRPIAGTLIELWQCNAAGRYHHPVDQHDAPLDPNFTGAGQVVTRTDGSYRFLTIKPGAYPWRNHPWAWRPAHIHLSLFGNAYSQRLVTQMFFPGDPLLPIDPVFNSVSEDAARQRMICTLDLEQGIEEVALGYRFDIVLRGPKSTPTGI